MEICDPCRSKRFYVNQNMIWQRLISIHKIEPTEQRHTQLLLRAWNGWEQKISKDDKRHFDVNRWLSWLSNIMTWCGVSL